jgi:hypothetical protein
MRALWPDLKLCTATEWLAVWQGPIHTLLRRYEVRITLIRPTFLAGGEFLWGGTVNPHVWVVSPNLKIPVGERRLPHTYRCNTRPVHQDSLCLFFRHDQEWSQSDYVAETIVPWIGEWLHFYEGWLATGVFYAPGVHVGDEDYATWESRAQEETKPRGGPPAPYRRSADNYIGRRTGTFASLPLMAAASKGSTRPPSWRGWRYRSLEVGRSANTSTSSLELPRAA